MPSLLAALLLAAGLVQATIDLPSTAEVLISPQGTAGLGIEGTAHELAFTERDGELVFRVPLAGVDTGIGLRNRHLRGYLDAARFPDAEVHVARAALVLPAPGKASESDVAGTFAVRGVSRPCSVHYRVDRGASGGYRVQSSIRIDLRDFGVEVPSCLGVRVDRTLRSGSTSPFVTCETGRVELPACDYAFDAAMWRKVRLIRAPCCLALLGRAWR